MSQEEFARMLGLSREGYGNYERGQRQMGILAVQKIRQKTNIDPLTLEETTSGEKLAVLASSDQATFRRNWLKELQKLRAEIVSAREAFDQKSFSIIRRRLQYFREIVFMSSLITVLLRLYAPELYLQPIDPAAKIDWSLLISFPAMTVLMPFQIFYFARFLRWHRTRKTERGQLT